MSASYRVVLLSVSPPTARHFLEIVRDLGHEVCAAIFAGTTALEDADAAPFRAAKIHAQILPRKQALSPLLADRHPELVLCFGFPWKLDSSALQSAALGCINLHPGLLPRYRGPNPLGWALRDGADLGVSWHRMSSEYDAGPILAQTPVPIDDDDCDLPTVGGKLALAAGQLLPRVFERVEQGEIGEPQIEADAGWAAPFKEDDAYAEIDWHHSARAIHDQVRAWNVSFGGRPGAGARATFEAQRVQIKRTSLADPGPGFARVETGAGALWLLDYAVVE